MKIAKWETFQGYHKTGPKWIKLHAGLIDKPEWMRLPLVAKAVLPLLWIAASRSGSTGELPDEPAMLAMLCHMQESEVLEALPSLVAGGFVLCEGFVAQPAKDLSQGTREECRPRERERESRERGEIVCAGDPDADAIDRLDAELDAEEKRFSALVLAVRDSGEDVQAVLDSLPRPKTQAPFSARRWLSTGLTGISRSDGGLTVLRLTCDALEARARAQGQPQLSDANRQTLENIRKVGDRMKAQQSGSVKEIQ